MRLVKLLKLLAPVGLAVVTLSVNPDTSSGQFPPSGGGFPGGDRGSRGDRGGFGGDRGDRGDRGSRGFGGMSPGGFGGGMTPGGFGGGGFNPSSMADGSFARLQASYGGSGDTLDYSKIPAQTREQTNAMAQRFGGEPMPTSGSITKDQYREQFAKRMEAMRGNRGGSPTVMTFGAPGSSASPTTMSVTPQGGFPGAPSGGFTPGSGFPPGGGNDPSQMSDEQIRQFMSRYDQDRDGRISAAEAQQSDRLRGSFEQYDTARMSSRGNDQNSMSQSWGQQGNWGQPGGNWGGFPGGDGRPTIPQEEPKPIVLRYGKLPKDLPGWFTSLDTDQDGQIGLYEWRKERQTDEFVKMDTNADGLLTAEEYLKFKNPNFTLASLAPKQPEFGGNAAAGGDPRGRDGDRGRDMRGGPPSGGSPWGGPPSGDRGGNSYTRSENAQPGSNPFNSRGENGPSSREERKDRKDDERRDRGNDRERGRGPGGPGGSPPGGSPFRR
jgi:hypothetical protein